MTFLTPNKIILLFFLYYKKNKIYLILYKAINWIKFLQISQIYKIFNIRN